MSTAAATPVASAAQSIVGQRHDASGVGAGGVQSRERRSTPHDEHVSRNATAVDHRPCARDSVGDGGERTELSHRTRRLRHRRLRWIGRSAWGWRRLWWRRLHDGAAPPHERLAPPHSSPFITTEHDSIANPTRGHRRPRCGCRLRRWDGDERRCSEKCASAELSHHSTPHAGADPVNMGMANSA